MMDNLVCPQCKSDSVVKNGKRQNQQSFLCKDCRRQFTSDNSFIEREKRAALTLCCFGLSFRRIAQLMGYSHVTILNWAHEFEERDTIQLYDYYFMELDEVCDFLVERAQCDDFSARFKSLQEALLQSAEIEIGRIAQRVLNKIADSEIKK